jgi:hypothetical protein
MPKVADKLDVAERFMYLNVISDYSRQGFVLLAEFDVVLGFENLFDEELYHEVKSLIHFAAGVMVDSDLMLRMGNAWYDRVADACRGPTRAGRREAIGVLDSDIGKLKKRVADTKAVEKAMTRGDRRQALSEWCGQILLAFFPPDVRACTQSEDTWAMRFDLDKLGFALAAYRAERGRFPAGLADLTPHYVVKVPEDLFNDSALHYRLEGKGYLLYSVGPNGKDDGGKTFEDRKKGEDWDDIVVRVPAPANQKQ